MSDNLKERTFGTIFIFKGCLNGNFERTNHNLRYWHQLQTESRWRVFLTGGPLSDGTVFTSGGKTHLWPWAPVPVKYPFHRFLWLQWRRSNDGDWLALRGDIHFIVKIFIVNLSQLNFLFARKKWLYQFFQLYWSVGEFSQLLLFIIFQIFIVFIRLLYRKCLH